MDKELISGLKRENFQAVVQGKETDLFVLTNSNGMEVCITNYGGAIMAIMVPDREGKMANVIQGHDSIQNMISSQSHSSRHSLGVTATASPRDTSR